MAASKFPTAVPGGTQMVFPRMGLGTGTSGFACQSRQSRQEPGALADLLLAAHARGITWWDSSDDYGTHPHLALALAQVSRASVRVSTKTHARSREEAIEAVERALVELKTSYIDVFFLHDLDDPAEIQNRRGAHLGLLEARSRGLVGAVGFSTHNIDTLEACLDIEGLDLIMTNFNRFEDHMDAGLKDYTRALMAHHAAGRGVFVMKAVGEGRLAHVAAESIRWNLEQEFVDSVLVGMETLAEVEKNARIALGSFSQ